VTGVFTANFATNYDWSAMLTNYNWYSSYAATSVQAIARLMYDVGVAVNMNYGTNASTAYMGGLASAFSTYFRYTRGTYVQTNTASLALRLWQDLVLLRPLAVSFPGHAIVADGASSDSGTNVFHFNYGWGGNNDGWYLELIRK
jgi:hypothetical protein